MTVPYQVSLFRRISANAYETEPYNITKYVARSGFNRISQKIDDGEFAIGRFAYNDLTLRLFNQGDIFHEPEISLSSIFPLGRDRTIVEINFTDDDKTELSFKGIINDESTRIDEDDSIVNIKVLSIDSILRKQTIGAGIVRENALLSDVMRSVINSSPEISILLEIDENNFTLGENIEIDDENWFVNRSVARAINDILIASNSTMHIIQNSGANKSTIQVFPRGASPRPGDIFRLRGRGAEDPNILSIKGLNNGLHRAFNSVTINNTSYVDFVFSEFYSRRETEYTLGFINNNVKEGAIARRIVETFRAPKIEMKVTVPTRDVATASILSLVSINQPGTAIGTSRLSTAIINSARIGESIEGLRISPSRSFFIYAIKNQLKLAVTELTLRESGITTTDGFIRDLTARIGFSIINTSIIADTISSNILNNLENARLASATIGQARLGNQ